MKFSLLIGQFDTSDRQSIPRAQFITGCHREVGCQWSHYFSSAVPGQMGTN